MPPSSVKIGGSQSPILISLLFVSTIVALRTAWSSVHVVDQPKFDVRLEMQDPKHSDASSVVNRLRPLMPAYLQKVRTEDLRSGTGCWRECPPLSQRINKIVYLHHKPDGLNDRLHILKTLLNIAGYLCATVEVRKPSKMLATFHNHNKQTFSFPGDTQYESGGEITNSHFRWSDFFNFTLHNEGRKDLPDTVNAARISAVNALQEIPTQLSHAKEYFQSSADDHRRYFKLITDDPRDAFRHWKQIEKYSWQATTTTPPMDQLRNDPPSSQLKRHDQEGRKNSESEEGKHFDGFMWTINANWYTMERVFYVLLHKNNTSDNGHKNDNHGQRRLQSQSSVGDIPPKSLIAKMVPYPMNKGPSESACNYLLEDTVPSRLRYFVDHVWQQIISHSSPTSSRLAYSSATNNTFTVQPIVGMFHIRRTDSQSECDTSLGRIESYVTCSFRRFSMLYNNRQHGDLTVETTMPLASDEKDQTYRDSVRNILLRQNWRIVEPSSTTVSLMVSKVIDLDTLVEREVHDAAQSGYLPFYVENNNYFNYRVEQIMSSDYVSFNLKQRRTAHCNYCDPILIHISEP